MIAPEDLIAPTGPALELWPRSPKAISWSQVSRHWKCPESYRIAYRTEIEKQPSGAMLAGSAVHLAIEVGEREGWWTRPAAEVVDLAQQAFVVALGLGIAGARPGEDLALPPADQWRPPWRLTTCPKCGGAGAVEGRDAEVPCERQVRIEGVDALKWGGRVMIVEDEAGQKIQASGPSGLPLWRDRSGGPDYEAEAPTARTNSATGRTSKDLAQWVKAREDLAWWVRNGPLMVRRAGELRRRDAAIGTEVLAGAVERRLEIHVPFEGEIVPIVVIPDVALINAGGELRIRDYKSGSFSEPMQLAFYGWALGELPDGHPLQFPATVGEIASLRKPSVDDVLEEFDLTQWIPLIPALVARHLAAVRAEVAAGEIFELRPSSWCPTCDVRAGCMYGRTLPEREG